MSDPVFLSVRGTGTQRLVDALNERLEVPAAVYSEANSTYYVILTEKDARRLARSPEEIVESILENLGNSRGLFDDVSDDTMDEIVRELTELV